ncbi:MAG: phage holin family protein [Methanomassiliicoccus sp.]|nr:phage holin family protein [Methanomassiliicoccus sp.]
MAGTRQCPECDTSVRMSKKYCPECHTTVNPNAPEDPIVKAKEDASFKSILLMGLAGMAMFFSFGFFLPAVMAEPGFIWVSAALFTVGAILFLGAWIVRARARKQIALLEESLHVKCEYCGGINDKDEHRCTFCGAPIMELPKVTST